MCSWQPPESGWGRKENWNPPQVAGQYEPHRHRSPLRTHSDQPRPPPLSETPPRLHGQTCVPAYPTTRPGAGGFSHRRFSPRVLRLSTCPASPSDLGPITARTPSPHKDNLPRRKVSTVIRSAEHEATCIPLLPACVILSGAGEPHNTALLCSCMGLLRPSALPRVPDKFA